MMMMMMMMMMINTLLPEFKLDGMKEYIAANQLPMDLQRRVIQWFDFAWRYKKDMSEEELFQQLNDNFRAEIAIHVNLDTLKKVKMFEHCDPSFLRELVLKLKPMLCSPGKTEFVSFRFRTKGKIKLSKLLCM